VTTFSAFIAKGRWLKGNCHTHTTLSDGSGSPREIAAIYEKMGYDFLVLTDHWKTQPDAAALSTEKLLVINGVELHPLTSAPAPERHHILGIGINEPPPREKLEKAGARTMIRWIERNGGIPVYCHPYWTGHNLDHMKEGRGCLGVEVFNTTCETTRGLGDSSVHYDHALSAGIRWHAFAVDDTHRARRDAGRGWIMVKAETCARKAVLEAIRKGRFYASMGPEIHSITLRRSVLDIRCSPVRKIVWAAGHFGTAIHAGRKNLTGAQQPLTKGMRKTRYLRVEITDARGRKAWSNPIYQNRRTHRWSDA